jgi:hypothetical protein
MFTEEQFSAAIRSKLADSKKKIKPSSPKHSLFKRSSPTSLSVSSTSNHTTQSEDEVEEIPSTQAPTRDMTMTPTATSKTVFVRKDSYLFD